jgi:PPOX class probable F420-dependent enzyme
MAVQLTDRQIKLFKDKNIAFIGTLMRDGRPQVTPVWVEFDGTHVIVNSEEKRAKVRNLKRDPRVSVSVASAENPYTYAEIRGKVVEITRQGGAEGIDMLAKKYLGQDKYPYNKAGDVRVVIRIEPLEVSGQ